MIECVPRRQRTEIGRQVHVHSADRPAYQKPIGPLRLGLAVLLDNLTNDFLNFVDAVCDAFFVVRGYFVGLVLKVLVLFPKATALINLTESHLGLVLCVWNHCDKALESVAQPVE